MVENISKRNVFTRNLGKDFFPHPNLKLSSLSIIEVVGILPHSVGDLIITPKDFTVQKVLTLMWIKNTPITNILG